MDRFTKLDFPPVWRDLLIVWVALTAPYRFRGLIA